MWAPKIVPTEHQGVLIRVHGSSGTLFDPSFLRYQVAELTRLRQISCEIFVSEGLEAALNIDRESFNYAHPHVVYITRWLHAALRRVATIQKRISGEIREDYREATAIGEEKTLSRIVTRAWQEESDDPGAEPPPIEFDDRDGGLLPVKPGTYRFSRRPIFGESKRRRTRQDQANERKLRAMIQLLAAYGVIENMTDLQREHLLAGMPPDIGSVRHMSTSIYDQSHSQDDLRAEIFSDIEYTQPRTAPKEFKPWHRPRKQFVRRKQWSVLLRRLYENRSTGDPLRYLGLPGTDLIDLRYLHEQLCGDSERPLCFLGFNTEAQYGSPAHVELNVSLDEVRRLPNVDEQSDVLPDDFRLVGNENSIAWSRAQQLGPFDVVNIDLCDGIASDPPQNGGSIYGALAKLMALQSRNSNPWLLLITTRIGRGMFDAEAEQRLISHFRENVANCEGFAEECERLLESDVAFIDPATCSEADLLNLTIVAIGKWLSMLVQSQAPSRVELASTHGYRVDPDAAQEDLVSLALRFEPVIEASPDALSPTPPARVDECATAKAILRRSAHRLDVDTILKQQPDLREELIGETQRLLVAARYPVDGYRAWLS